MRNIGANMRVIHSASNSYLPHVKGYIRYAQVAGTTAVTYKSILTLFLNNCRNLTDPSSVLLYVEDLRLVNNDLTVHNKCSQIRAFLKYLDDLEIVPNKCHLHLKVKTTYQGGLKSEIPADKIDEIFKRIDTTTIVGKRNFALLRLYQSTGMRLSEPLKCRIQDMKTEGEDTFIYFKQKGGKNACVKLFPKTRAAIVDYLNSRGTNEPVDPIFANHNHHYDIYKPLGSRGVQLILKGYFESVGLFGRQYTCHSLRYGKAMDVLRATGSEEQASMAVRHLSKQTITFYTAEHRNKLIAQNGINTEI